MRRNISSTIISTLDVIPTSLRPSQPSDLGSFISVIHVSLTSVANSSFLDSMRSFRPQYVSYPSINIDPSVQPLIRVDPTTFHELRS